MHRATPRITARKRLAPQPDRLGEAAARHADRWRL